ncbi:MAG TPA: ATP-binding protein, partial [Prolixibacteraceae bacterium]|nr:ATP-binding protein [Prolixibacteraceae bacterium]
KNLRSLASQFKAVAIVGPRQSGKTTLAKYVFPDKKYISLENPDTRNFANEDPRGFLDSYNEGAIFDEIQKVPHLFSYLQQIIDETNEPGKFILTGSNNFLLQEGITQSLAGRIAYQLLLPFSINEIIQSDNVGEMILKGFYPPLYDQKLDAYTWHKNYISTYVERDVRQLKSINNLETFSRFIRLCAGRTGQLLNLSSLAIEVGVDHKTIGSWLGILESSYIIHRLQPHYTNFNKRLVKMPKIYFHDTGVLCALLGIQNVEQLNFHPLWGNIFENFVVNELVKKKINFNLRSNLFFWRDSKGYEIDVLVENGLSLYPIEIKSGQTISSEYFKNLNFWKSLTGNEPATVIYNRKETQKRSNGHEVIFWKDIYSTNQIPL